MSHRCWRHQKPESNGSHSYVFRESRLKECTEFHQVKAIIDDYIDYHNNDEYVWDLCMLSPNEFYKFVTTGIYPLNIKNPPKVPEIRKLPHELGIKSTETTCTGVTCT